MNGSDQALAAPEPRQPGEGRFSVVVQADARTAGDLLVVQQRALDEARYLSQQNQARALRYNTDEVPAWSHTIKGSTPVGTFTVTFRDEGFVL